MKNQVKNFSQFVNESKFYHSLPNNSAGEKGRLRDEFKELSADAKEEIEKLANELAELGILSKFKRSLSGFRNIAEVKKVMKNLLTSIDNEDK